MAEQPAGLAGTILPAAPGKQPSRTAGDPSGLGGPRPVPGRTPGLQEGF